MKIDNVRLYMVKVPKELCREEFIKLFGAIDESKKKKILGFRKQEDRIRGLLADNLVRYLAMRTLEIKNKDISYEYNYRGKPAIQGYEKFCFNVSHSGDYVICAVGSASVGCDIQQKLPCDTSMGKVIFTSEEQECVHNTNEFYRMWTLKEALLKAIGIGISDEGLRISIVQGKKLSDVMYSGTKYYFKHFTNGPEGYSLSIWSADNDISDEIREIDYRTIIKQNI